MNLDDRVVMVTGAGRGIGRATALALSAAGARVVLCSRSEESLRSVAGAAAGETLVVAADLTRPDEVGRGFAEAVARWGRLDGLVNSAGLGRIAALSDGDPDDWRAMWEINVYGLALCCREALRHFPAGGGQVVNLCSLSGHRVPAVGGFYSATKFAVRAMTESLRLELRAKGDPTRVTAVSPGFVDTPLVDEYLGAAGKSRADLGIEMIPPEEVARAIVHIFRAPAAVEYADVLVRPRDQSG